MAKGKKVSSLLVADDDGVVIKLIRYSFEQAGLFCDAFESGDKLLEVVNEETQACVLDLNMPGTDGLRCLKRIRKRFPHVEVVILSTVNQAAEAVEAVRAGAFDYLTKPFDPPELIKSVRKAMQLSRQQRENADLRSSLSESLREPRLLGSSASMKRVMETLSKYAVSDRAVLFTGESGTGKTLLARALHAQSRRREGPFVSVSCPSLPGELLESEMFGHEKGAFSGATRRRLGRAELADGGTLFLDEIGEMSLDLQSKLLTFLQDKSFFRLGGERSLTSDSRIVAATNQDLQARVREGLFREDLYFRLNVLPLEVPPLRARKGDIAILAADFIERNAVCDGFEPPVVEVGVFDLLDEYSWPGNIRELENSVARAYALRQRPDRMQMRDFQQLLKQADGAAPPPESGGGGYELARKTLAKIERDAICATLDACGGNKSEAARELGIAEKSIYNKIKRHGLPY